MKLLARLSILGLIFLFAFLLFIGWFFTIAVSFCTDVLCSYIVLIPAIPWVFFFDGMPSDFFFLFLIFSYILNGALFYFVGYGIEVFIRWGVRKFKKSKSH